MKKNIIQRNKTREVLNFISSGIIGFIVDLTITMIGTKWLGVFFARIPAFICAATVTWVYNRNITFSHQLKEGDKKSLKKEYSQYLLAMSVGLVVNYCVYSISIIILQRFINNNYFLVPVAVMLGSLAGMSSNFFTAKKVISTEKKLK